jgi:hypothetical protein
VRNPTLKLLGFRRLTATATASNNEGLPGQLPFNLVPFLDYAAERIFLRKVGGGYIFIHRYLMEYFAALEAEG